MTVSEALHQRKSTRAFLPKPVERSTLETILEAARWAPSGANTQPWSVVVLTGSAKSALEDRLVDAFRQGHKETHDYTYYPVQWEEPYLGRRRATGFQLYQALGIAREDKAGRLAQWAENYRAFRAPALLLFFLDPLLEAGSYLDYGMFLQSIMLQALELGLATCPQAAFAEYPVSIKDQLGIPPEKRLLCGIALGYPDPDHPINQYRTPRVPVADFCRFIDQTP